MTDLAPTPRTTLGRRPNRGIYDRDTVYSILDEALICHVGFAVEGQPFVLPTIHTRIEDRLYFHGSVGSRMLKALRRGTPVCVTVTLLDALVLARSAFHHSMNYRSVVVLGTAQEVVDTAEKQRVFTALVNHVVPGRATEVRTPNEQELKATAVLCLPITEASAKARTGPPIDDEEDYSLSCWAGLLPLELRPQTPVPDARLAPGTPIPTGVATYERPRRREPV